MSRHLPCAVVGSTRCVTGRWSGTVAAPQFPLACALTTQRRHITRLFTSYYRGQLFPNQLVRQTQRMPRGVSLQAARKGNGVATATEAVRPVAAVPEGETEGVSWRDVESTDLVHANTEEQQQHQKQWKLATIRPERPYAPLGEAAKLELQGDYLTEGGLHQEALEHYGVVAKVYEAAYPENHAQRIGILLKLSGAFRRTGRLESSKANLEKAVAMLDASPSPSLELIVEALLELGLTKEALEEADAGSVYEEAVTVADQFHNYGESHRMLRLLPRLGRRFNLNFEEKFLYYSPFDYDRTFALVDQCLHRAEGFYQRRNDSDGVIRVLQQRKELIDKKFFNMRDFAGRIRTMRGHWMRRAQHLTNAPTPDELLRYSPTIHQPYRDFRYELNTPIGREKEVSPGVNRVVMDMGNPYRRKGRASRNMMRDADNNFAKYVRSEQFGGKP